MSDQGFVATMKLVPFLIVMLLSVVHGPVSLSAQELTPVGVWLHDNERIRVKVAPCDEQRDEPLCGKIVWLKNPEDEEGKPRLDTENPDQAQRDQLVIGTTVIHGLVRSGPRVWTDGTIYNPDDGETYRARVTVVDPNTLHVRIYVMLPLFGETKVWTRVED
ncbi:DUF2147 domain-containing protein [Ferruginivarius sediminum]|nr:DUF2147 domain-containing protein [Ferruginivarius sediminum]